MYPVLYRHILSRTNAERIHHQTLRLLALGGRVAPGLIRRMFGPPDTDTAGLEIQTLGLSFPHPLGLAAGFDKDALAIPGWEALGFAHIEVGTITPAPQPGNDRPRLFRVPADRALINRMGFPSAGAEAVARNLHHVRHARPLGVSLGKQKTTPLLDAARDYSQALAPLYPNGDFFVINISSPNTPELRKLQTREYLDDLLATMRGALTTLAGHLPPKPLLVKIAPDLDLAAVDTILDLALHHHIDGLIATNTTIRAEVLSRPFPETGGISGQPLRARSTELIRHISRSVGQKLVIIGVGGIFNGDDIWEKLLAGATLVQAYTGLVYEGPAFVRKAIKGLRQRMAREGIQRLADIIGQGR